MLHRKPHCGPPNQSDFCVSYRTEEQSANSDSKRMKLTNPAPDAVATLELLWGEATAAVIRAQLDYRELASRDVVEPRALDAAWLRLWRAEERQRELAREFDGLVASD
jgi:hypothetical protein